MPTRRARVRTAFGLAVALLIVCQSNPSPLGANQAGAVEPAADARGLYLTAESQLGILPARPLYWHIYEYPSRAAADAARGERGTVAQVFGRHWLYTIAEEGWRPSAGDKITVIGPLQIATDTPYTARYMQALFPADAPTPYPGPGHRHPGPEAWYVVSGGQCLETPNGLVVAKAGQSAMVPEGWPMSIANLGPEIRRALVLVLHRSAEPYSMPIDDPRSPGAPHAHWIPQGNCPK